MNFKKNWRSLLLVHSTLILLLTGGTFVYAIVDHYKSMKIKEIDTFETFWPNVFDENTKLIKRASEDDIKKLKSLAQTPTDKSRAIFIEISNQMDSLTRAESSLTIDQIMSILAEYQINEKHDDSFSEQQTINVSILSKAEEFIQQAKDSVSYLHFSDDNSQLIFDQNLTESTKIPTISTEIRWNKLDTFNSKISELNSSMESQVKENHDKAENTKIIELKPAFDSFVKSVDEMKNSLKNEYMSIKTLREFEKIVKKIDTSKAAWFSDSKVFDYRDSSTNSKLYFSDQFFTDNPSLESLKSDLKLIPINTEIKSELLETNTKSNEKKTMNVRIDMTDFSGTSDDDLIRKTSIYNIKIDMYVNQTQVKYKEPRVVIYSGPSNSSSSSSRSEDTTPSRATSPSSGRRRN